MPRVSQHQLDARRQQILAGARTCFARHGYEGATVRRLEQETGLSRGAIFHHFRDKDSLFLAVAADAAAAMVETVARNGLVQVMWDLLARAAAPETAGWLGTQLEVSRRVRTDPEFARRLAVTAVALVAVFAAGGFALDRLAGAGGGPASTGGGPVGGGASPLADPEVRDAGPPPPARRPDAPFPAAAPATRAPVLSLPGDIPDRGPGSFRFATGRSEVWGDAGPVRRFRLAVEDGVPENLTALAGFVDATLSHPQGWAGGGDLRLRRVPEGAGHDFTIYLATSATVARMCAEVGLDVVGRGLPEGGVSCRTPGRAILNLHRWRLSVPEYVAAEIPLETYRRMLLNHEVGHELGHGHVACPGAGEPAPVMQQQTLGLDGCTANPWPYLDGRRHTGAPTS